MFSLIRRCSTTRVPSRGILSIHSLGGAPTLGLLGPCTRPMRTKITRRRTPAHIGARADTESRPHRLSRFIESPSSHLGITIAEDRQSGRSRSRIGPGPGRQFTRTFAATLREC